jgi:hypothetical protein
MTDRHVGEGKAVTVPLGEIQLTGTNSANYNLSIAPQDVTVNISEKNVTIVGLYTNDKTYDGGTAAEVLGKGFIIGKVDGDDLEIKAGSANFADKDAVNADVTFSGYALIGEQAGNYQLREQPESVVASILNRPTVLFPETLDPCNGGDMYVVFSGTPPFIVDYMISVAGQPAVSPSALGLKTQFGGAGGYPLIELPGCNRYSATVPTGSTKILTFEVKGVTDANHIK